MAGEALKKGKSVVVDNTNPAKSARASFVELAKKNGKQFLLFVEENSSALIHDEYQLCYVFVERCIDGRRNSLGSIKGLDLCTKYQE